MAKQRHRQILEEALATIERLDGEGSFRDGLDEAAEVLRSKMRLPEPTNIHILDTDADDILARLA